MANLTTLEAAVLDHIARNCYQPTNFSRPERFEDTRDIWRHSILDSSSKTEVSPRSLPGVCASLVKKGLIICTEDGKDSTIRLTESGFAAWDAAFPMTPEEIKAEDEARGVVAMPEEPADLDDGTQNPEQGVAPVTAEPVVPPTPSLPMYLLEAERRQQAESYRVLLGQLVRESTEALRSLDSGRLSSHDGINLGRRCADLQALATVITSLDACIASCK